MNSNSDDMFFYLVLVDAPVRFYLGAAMRLGSECGKHFWLSEMFVLMGTHLIPRSLHNLRVRCWALRQDRQLKSPELG